MLYNTKCNHPKEHQTIVVVGGWIVEITRVKCTKCNKFITEPKSE